MFRTSAVLTCLHLIAISTFVLSCAEATGTSRLRLQPPSISVEAEPGQSRVVRITVENRRSHTQAYDFVTPSDEVSASPSALTLPGNSSAEVKVEVRCPVTPGFYTYEVEVHARHRRSVDVLPIAMSCGAIAQHRATLRVALEGLPEGASAPAILTTPAGERVPLRAGSTLHHLPPGAYSLSAPDVLAAGQRFAPNLRQIELQLAPNRLHEVVLNFLAERTQSSAQVRVSPQGLPEDATLTINLRAETGGAIALSPDHTLEGLAPGRYTVTYSWAHAALPDGSPWLGRPQPAQHTLELDDRSRVELRPSFSDARYITSALDRGEDSLRRAITEASAGTTLYLTEHLDLIELEEAISIDKDLVILGNGPATNAITTRGKHGALRVEPGHALTLSRLTLRDAAGPDDAAVVAHGDLELYDVTFERNLSSGGPAAIAAHAQLSAYELRLIGNRSAQSTGGLWLGPDAFALVTQVQAIDNQGLRGGALFNLGELTLAEGYFTLNQADEGGALQNEGRLHGERMAFWHNRTRALTGPGGAISSRTYARLAHITFGSNLARMGGALSTRGDTRLSWATFYANHADRNSDTHVTVEASLRIEGSLILRPHNDNENYDNSSLQHARLNTHIVTEDIIVRYHDGLPGAVLPADLSSIAPLIPEHCDLLRSSSITLDQLGNPRPHAAHCTPGAIEPFSSPPLVDRLNPGLRSSTPHTGLFVSQRGLTYHFQNAYRHDHPLHLAGGRLRTRFAPTQRVCHASILVHAPAHTLPTLSIFTDQPFAPASPTPLGEGRWRFDKTSTTPFSELHVATTSPEVAIVEIQASERGCASLPGLDTPPAPFTLREDSPSPP